jgi:tripartite-type tricarboxylate transporter receptor subunit TctC
MRASRTCQAGNVASPMGRLTTAPPLLRDGRARLLTLTSAGRLPLAPEVPALA